MSHSELQNPSTGKQTTEEVPLEFSVEAFLHEIFGTEQISAESEQEEEIDAHGANDSVGTKKVGYASPDMGPFLCLNCVHSNREGNRCNHPEVVEDPEIPKKGGLAVIQPAACCNEFHPRDTPE